MLQTHVFMPASIAGVTLSGVDYEGPYFLDGQGQAATGFASTQVAGLVVSYPRNR